MENDVLYNRIMNVVHEEYGPPGEGTKEITITENGTTTEDVRSYVSAEITVTVPNSYTESDEGKVVDSGALVSQSSATYTENDTYDTTLIDEVIVNVSGSGGTDYLALAISNSADFTSYESNEVTSVRTRAFSNMTNIVSIRLPNATKINSYSFENCSKLESVYLPKGNASGNYVQNVFSSCTKLTALALPEYTTTLYGQFCNGCTSLRKIDLPTSQISFSSFNGCTNLAEVILRKTSVTSLNNISAFTGTPFASSGTGGTLYVPQALISSYQSANNWSTILGYANNSIQAIEGSQYENYYVDGTPIPTP